MHLVKNAAELMAAIHVADGHEVGIDHAEPFVARGRPADHAQAGSAHPVHLHRGGGVHEDTKIGAVQSSFSAMEWAI